VTGPARAFIEYAAGEAEPAIACDRGVSLVTSADRALHAPDRLLLLTEAGSLVARCSCWWSGTPRLSGEPTGVIGHYAAADPAAGQTVLARACELLAVSGASVAIGPMDGSTWRRYRFIVERGQEPTFFLEPDHPDEWPRHWEHAGFSSLATYASAVVDDLDGDEARAAEVERRLADAGVTTRALDLSRAEAELTQIFELSLDAFADNFLYTPIGREEFFVQYHAVLPYVRPELVLMAERGGELIGFMFALPNVLESPTGRVDTLILKTLAVTPSMRGARLGTALLVRAQRAARELGFHRAIHALMHQDNVSRRISDHYARTIRRYALLQRRLVP